MKVILLQDVAKIGKRFEIVEVPDGHARNFLLPRGMAEAATPDNLKRIDSRKSALTAKQEESDKAFADTCAKLGGTTVTIKVKANEDGNLFQSVKVSDVADHISREIGPIAPEHLDIETPIKEAGERTVKVMFGAHECEFTLNVTGE